jgi:very-short-patch-repair endonuclease
MKNGKFIEKSKLIHGEKYDYSKVVYVNNTKPVLIGYQGIFYEVTPANHLKGSKIERMKRKFSINDFIDLANKVHNYTYSYEKVVFHQIKKDIIITCKIHGDFIQKAIYHIEGHGCSKCGKISMSEKVKIPKVDLIKKIQEKWNDKYELLNLDDIIDSKSTIKINCQKHGNFEKKVKDFIRHGCKSCGHEISDLKKSINRVEFIKKSNLIWNSFYDYSEFEYTNSSNKSTIICPIHGKFEQNPQNHLKSGCKACGYEKVSEKTKYTKEEFIEKGLKIHGECYDYSMVEYKNSRNLVKIICKEHGIFEQKAGGHLMGYGCRICCESQGEKYIRIFLEKTNIKFEREKKFKDCRNKMELPFDFYLPQHKILIEFDGKQHFESMNYFGGKEGLEYLKYNDKIKDNFCDENNIKLIRIPYWDINNIEKILEKEIISND